MLPFGPRTTVVNMRNGNKNFDVRIDRQSEWGNKYHMRRDTLEERNRVCDEHATSLWLKIYSGDITLSQLDALYGKRLGCWCFPKRCHGNDIVEAVEWAHATLCKWERIKRTYRKRRNAKRAEARKAKSKNSGHKKKVSRK